MLNPQVEVTNSNFIKQKLEPCFSCRNDMRSERVEDLDPS